MKGLIATGGETCYSTFGKIFSCIGCLSTNYNWLVSYPECYPQDAKYKKLFENTSIWLTGQEMKSMLEDEDFQWIWGVISGFDKDINYKDIIKYPLPYADGYPGFWTNPISIQHPLAEIEMVAWDSSSSLFICKNNNIIKKISFIYPQAKDLEEYNISNS